VQALCISVCAARRVESLHSTRSYRGKFLEIIKGALDKLGKLLEVQKYYLKVLMIIKMNFSLREAGKQTCLSVASSCMASPERF